MTIQPPIRCGRIFDINPADREWIERDARIAGCLSRCDESLNRTNAWCDAVLSERAKGQSDV